MSCTELISNPVEVLKNLRTHLKPSGKLLIVVPTGKNTLLYQVANEMFSKYELETPWSKNNRINDQNMRTMNGCSLYLNQAGYIVESMEIIDTDNPFYDLDDFITWLMGTTSVTWQIPFSMSQSFFTDLAHRMYELDPSIIDEEGRVHFQMPRLHTVAIPNTLMRN